MAFFENAAWSTRAAYNWRGEFLSSTFDAYGPNPQYTEAYGQVDIDNLYDVAHSEFQEAWSMGLFGLPPKVVDVPKETIRSWPEERASALALLEIMAKQITNINVRTDELGNTKFTKNGAKQFIAKGRKDFAYAGMYAFAKFMAWLRDHGDEFIIPEEDAAMCC